MKQIFRWMAAILTLFMLIACTQKPNQNNTAENINLPKTEKTLVLEEMTMTNAFNFETKTVMLNSGYEMPIYGMGN